MKADNPYQRFLIMVQEGCTYGEADIMIKENCSLIEAKKRIEERKNLEISNNVIKSYCL